MARMLSFCAGVCSLLVLPRLPCGAAILAQLVLALAAAVLAMHLRTGARRGACLLLCLFVLGSCYGQWRAGLALQYRLPLEFNGVDFQLQGRVTGIVSEASGLQFGKPKRRQRFVFLVDTIVPLRDANPSETVLPRSFPRRLQLSNYSVHDMQSGQRWRFVARLRSPRGSANPGGFDLARHALANRIDGYGYLRERHPALLLEHGRPSLRINRHAVLQPLLQERGNAAVFNALLLGDKSGLAGELRELFIATGTAHLMAISGLHIGIAATWGAALGKLVLLARPGLLLYLPARQLLLASALPAALFYAALAGFSISTQRALAMLALAALALLLNSRSSAAHVLALAAVLLLVLDPLCILSGGFWLSFGAVVALVLVFGKASAAQSTAGLIGRSIRAVAGFARAQLALFLFMPAVQLGFGLPAPFLAPLANCVAVPVISLWVIPLGLAALIASYFSLTPAAGLLALADTGLQGVIDALHALQDSALADVRIEGGFGLLPRIVALFAAALLLGSRRGPVFLLAFLLWLAVLVVPQLSDRQSHTRAMGWGDFELLQIDVGQGTSILLRTRSGNWLVDTGASFGFGRDAANSMILPVLAHLRIDRLDAVILSHADSDHTGGARSLHDAVAVTRWYTGGDAANVAGLGERAITCGEGTSWERDGVLFRFVYPRQNSPVAQQSENAASCVLSVESLRAAKAGVERSAGRVLLTGDIERESEWALLGAQGPELAAAVLSVPHHGSKTSSTTAFLQRVAPRYALVGSGFGNRYGHPHEAVIARYAKQGVTLLRSDWHGAIALRFIGGAWQAPLCWRARQRHFWSYAAGDDSCTQ